MINRMLIGALCASAVLSAHAEYFEPEDSNIGGGTSNPADVVPGPSTLMAQGLAGIAMPVKINNNKPDTTKIVSFEHGPIFQTNTQIAPNGAPTGHGYIEIENQNGVKVKMSEAWKHTVAAGIGQGTEVYAYRQLRDALPHYPQFGGEVIGKVTDIAANADGSAVNVYFGAWAPIVDNPDQGFNPDLNMDHAKRTSWYVGENPTKVMPALVNAKYDLVGIRKYNPETQGGLYTGTVTANYGNGTGTLSGMVGWTWFNNPLDPTVIKADGSFVNKSGGIEGHFYGDQAQALAGISRFFTNPNNTMSFGGKKRVE